MVREAKTLSFPEVWTSYCHGAPPQGSKSRFVLERPLWPPHCDWRGVRQEAMRLLLKKTDLSKNKSRGEVREERTNKAEGSGARECTLELKP